MKNIVRSMCYIGLMGLIGCSAPEFAEKEKPSKELLNYSQILDQGAREKMIDLLIVVDNSTSMLADQEKLSREFNTFVSAISDSDYRIGVITTDTDSIGRENTPGFHGNLDIVPPTGRRFISKSDPNPSALFSMMINRVETKRCDDLGRPVNCVSFDERPMYAVKQAIDKRDSINQGFFRDGADLGVVIITDEDETNFSNGTYFSGAELLEHFEKEFEGKKNLTAFAIAIEEGDSVCLESQAAETNTGAASYGLRVGELANLTGGFSINICNDDFGDGIGFISDYVKRNLLPLTVQVPASIVLSSIRLKVTTPSGEPFKADFEVEGLYLRIFPLPPEGSKVELSYLYD